MSFSESGGVVTQSGTDANLSGAASYATVTNFGAYQVYNFGSNQLRVTGSLKINVLDNGVKEQLVIGTGDQGEIDIEVTSTGTLEVGLAGDSGDGTYVSAQHTASIVEKDINLDFGESRGKSDAWSGSTCPFLLVRGGGTFIWNGTICFCGGMAFDGYSNSGNTDAVITLNKAIWDARTMSENGVFDQIIYSYTRDITVTGLTVLAITAMDKAAMFTQLATPFNAIKGYAGVFTDAAFSGSTTIPVGFELTIEDYAGILGNDDGLDYQVQGRTDTTTGDVNFLNSARGNALALSSTETDTIALLRCTQGVSGTYQDSVGANVSDFIIGTLDGNDLLYSDEGASGVFAFGTPVKLCSFAGGAGISPMTKTDFSPSGSADDLYDFYTYAYGFNPISRMQVELRQVGGCALNFIGGTDLKITQATRATVDAYTTLDSGNKIYDRCMSWKIDDTNVTYPALSKLLATAVGDALDFGTLDIVLDSDFANTAYGNPETAMTVDQTETTEGTGITATATVRGQNVIIACDITFHATVDPVGCVLEMGGYVAGGGGGADFSLGPYSLSSVSNAEADFNFTDPIGTGLQANTARRWSWDSDDTPSSNVGPTSGQSGDGYVFPEASSPSASGDQFFMELDHTFDCEDTDVEVTFYTNQRGDDNDCTCVLQYQESGGSWTTIETYGGASDPNKVATSGTQIWALRTEDIPSNNSSVRLRWVLTLAGGTIWHNDYGLDTIEVTGTASGGVDEYESLYIGFTDNELVCRTGDNDSSPSNDIAEFRGSSVGFAGLGAYTIYTVIDLSTDTLKVYALSGGSTSGNQVTLLGSGTSSTGFSKWASSGDGGLGEVSGTYAGGESNSDFNGTVDEVRFFFNQNEADPFQPSRGSSCLDVNTSTDVVTIDTNGTLTGDNDFRQIGTTGTVTLENNANLTSYTVNGDVILNNPSDMTNLTINGNLTISTGADSTLDFSNVTVTGSVSNSDAAHTLTIGAGNCTMTASDAGTGDGQTNIVEPKITLTITGILAGSIVEIYDDEIANLGNYDTKLSYTSSSGTSFQYDHVGVANDVVVKIIKDGYVEVVQPFTLGTTNQALNIVQTQELN